MRVAATIVLTDIERATLVKWSRGRNTPARLVLRSKMVLARRFSGRSPSMLWQRYCVSWVRLWRNETNTM